MLDFKNTSDETLMELREQLSDIFFHEYMNQQRSQKLHHIIVNELMSRGIDPFRIHVIDCEDEEE